MRVLIAVALVLTTSALAQDSFLKGDALQAEIAKNCAEGCVTFNQQEAAALEIAIQKMVDQAAKQAFAEGQKTQRAACRSLI